MRHPAAAFFMVSHRSRLRLLRLRCAPAGDSLCRDIVLYIIRKLFARALFIGDGGREPLNWAGGGNHHADTRTGAEEATEEQRAVWPACYQSGRLRVDTSPANEGRTKILSGAGDLLRFHPGLGLRPFFCGEKKASIGTLGVITVWQYRPAAGRHIVSHRSRRCLLRAAAPLRVTRCAAPLSYI